METSLRFSGNDQTWRQVLLPGSMAASCDDIRSEIPNPMQKNNKKSDLVVCAKNGKVADPKEEKRQQKAELEMAIKQQKHEQDQAIRDAEAAMKFQEDARS